MHDEVDRAKAIFDRAVEIESPAERGDLVLRECADDAGLRGKVQGLLVAYDQAGSFLESPPAGVRAAETVDQPPDERPGTQIGPYKLLQPIGEGGMGTVYMAEQIHPVRRLVALKVIKAGMDSRQVTARFGAERQALALMDHPSIAKVLDAGTTDSGRPYFVMELVKGVPITRFCDEHRLTTRERIELAIPVCHAVQHAHQKGVIHRDLKPSNILVALYDDKPVPKVIDFGVAKAAGPRLTDQTLYTEFGAIVGTLEYMSPEQAQLNQLDIDTRSDIYSLGVMIYELLTGSTPLDRKRMAQAAFLEVLRVIREEDSPPPSVRLSTTDELPSIAACRHVEPRKLSGLMRGELDWIVMKALEKDRSRRYETANGFAADLRRYLDDEPVQACPPTAAYRLSKFARKNRFALATASAFVAVLIAASAISLWQAVRANRAYAAESWQRREAQDQRDRAVRAEGDARANLTRARAAVDDYLTTISESRLLKSPLPGLQPLRKDLLVTALRYYEDFVRRNQGDAGLRAELAAAFLRVGEITDQIGSKAEAQKAFQTASDLYEALARAAPPALSPAYRAGQGRCMVRAAMIEAEQGRAEISIKLFVSAIDLLEQIDRGEPRGEAIRADLALGHHSLARALMNHSNRHEAALRHQRAAIDLRKGLTEEFATQSSYRVDLALSLNNLGFALLHNGKPAEALDSIRQANAIQRALVKENPEDPQLRHTLALSARGMAAILKALDRWEESKPLFAESGEIMSRLVAENPAVTEFRRVLATGASEFGQQLIDHDEIDAGVKALDMARDHSEMVRKTSPSDFANLITLASIHRGIGKALAKKGKTSEALDSLRQAIDIGERCDNPLAEYDLACGLALYSEIVGRVSPPRGEESGDSARRYSDRAMQVLRQAVDHGFRDNNWIGRDPELRALHSRPDFQALLKGLREPGATPPGR